MRTRPGAVILPSRPTPISTPPAETVRLATSARSSASPSVVSDQPLARAAWLTPTPRAHRRDLALPPRPDGADALDSRAEAGAAPAFADDARGRTIAPRAGIDHAPAGLTAADVRAMIDRALADFLHDLEIDGERRGRSSWR